MLRGAWKRIGFLRDLLEADVSYGLEPLGSYWSRPWSRISDGRDGVTFIYFGEHRPIIWSTRLPNDDDNDDADIIDTWNMTVTPVEKVARQIRTQPATATSSRGASPDAAFEAATLEAQALAHPCSFPAACSLAT